ncbi:VIT1/CCC1 transporter family protein [Paraburkholderia sp. ZP32-5]|uniref:VIT1/CCC1 transporter family protein n=1 Tax=Paraburkholderia sp. ZP32-5 TaxID=2883245 RepID=UPI001F388F42|nr:VIT1/CCC1 transporter family protein [Paraburkholderia sp. ZP32-5]
MDTATSAQQDQIEKREPILSMVDRVSELCFGLFMALTFVGAVKAVTAGEDAGRKMFLAALGCNLAWGLADAVMFLVRTLAVRAQRLTLALSVKRERNHAAAVQTLRDALPKSLEPLVEDTELERIRARLAAVSTLPSRARFVFDDFLGALGIFMLVVISTFPVALPFLVVADRTVALVISRVLTLVMLFGAGFALGRYTGFSAMKAGFAMTTVGIVLTVAIIALGG